MITKSDHETVPTKPLSIRTMFNAIAPTYDILNHLLSFGLDIRWRKKAISFLNEKRSGTILDIATGSGDLAIEALKLQPHQIVASDFALKMLTVFKDKLLKRNYGKIITLVCCDALVLPFHEESFDAAMVAFGIRNFAERLHSLKEIQRVLKSSGLYLVLELTKPTAPGIAQLYKIYSHTILPLFGRIISRHNSAYHYLTESITNFPKRDEFLSLMTEAGFIEVRAIPLSFGIATIFIGRKKADREV
jgi:demethylmenaquinone methyltransferase / 2-methoxy-6-polyprenyl-1,4-benzoquinol methylase